MSDNVFTLMVCTVVFNVLVWGGSCSYDKGKEYGYSDGCRDGSRGHSQVVTVEGRRRCVPHPEAIRMRGP